MPGQEWRLQIGEVGERQSHILELFFAQILARRRRLHRQHGRPQRLLLEPRPELRAARYGQEGIDYRGIERGSSLATRELEGRVLTAELMNSFEEARREHNARRNW